MLLGKGSRGEIVKRLQTALAVKADGDYGPGTAQAVAVAQVKAGLFASGNIDVAEDWYALVGGEPPSLFERCINLTMQFEGHSFTKAAGNWDSAGVTWGVIGFQLKSGSLCEVIKRIPREVLMDTCGMGYGDKLIEVANTKSPTARIAWGDSISAPSSSKQRLIAPWSAAFEDLGKHPAARAAQLQVAKSSYWDPSQAALSTRAGWLRSERAAALWFDSFVQQGQVYSSGYTAAKQAADQGEQAVLEAVAKAQAQGTYAADILSRRMTIATGLGTVHGRKYDVERYGISIGAPRG